MIKTNLCNKSNAKSIVAKSGVFSVIEYERDLSIDPQMAQTAYYASKMDVRKRQLVANILSETGVVTQRGMMQLMLGDISVDTGLTGVKDLMKKLASSMVTNETAIKPHYTGNGTLVLEPTFNHILLEDLDKWKTGIVIEDGMFLACEDSVELKVEARKTASSLVLGNEGIFNSVLYGEGVVALESPVPSDEIIVVDIDDDIIKIDGNMAIAWSPDLEFTVEKTTSTLIGSAVSGEGFVNVYSGTGKVLIAPVRHNKGISIPDSDK